ncbi:MAG TPA: hypothetical protein VMF51_18210 [Nocardioides sp.]|uniref:hypothetical protein n=1 Tax=Nocardioides sp. TaxID=35761 RepID=UPI002B806168|nr:hypothetical protein [Nocardioides sp.]HTW17070.1 hypothetical protein [Nocardioides sp.]
MTPPNQPKTQHRSIRVPDERWARAKAKAAADGTTISAVFNAFLDEYAPPSEADGVDVELT